MCSLLEMNRRHIIAQLLLAVITLSMLTVLLWFPISSVANIMLNKRQESSVSSIVSSISQVVYSYEVQPTTTIYFHSSSEYSSTEKPSLSKAPNSSVISPSIPTRNQTTAYQPMSSPTAADTSSQSSLFITAKDYILDNPVEIGLGGALLIAIILLCICCGVICCQRRSRKKNYSFVAQHTAVKHSLSQGSLTVVPNESAIYESMTDLRTHGTFRTHNVQSKSHPPVVKGRTVKDTAPTKDAENTGSTTEIYEDTGDTTGVEIYEDATGIEIYEDAGDTTGGVELYEDMAPTDQPLYEMDDLTSDDASKTQSKEPEPSTYEMDYRQVRKGGLVPTLPPRVPQNTTNEIIDQPLYEMDGIDGEATNTNEPEPPTYEMDGVTNDIPSLPSRTSSNNIRKVFIPKPTVSSDIEDQPLYELDDPEVTEDGEEFECQHNVSYSMITPNKQSTVQDETEPLYD